MRRVLDALTTKVRGKVASTQEETINHVVDFILIKCLAAGGVGRQIGEEDLEVYLESSVNRDGLVTCAILVKINRIL